VKYTQWIIFGLVIGAIWTLGFLFETNLNPYVVRVIVNCGIAMILAMSLNLVNGCAGQFSLGHAGFMGVGAYLSAAITTLLPVAFPQLSFLREPLGIGIAVVVGGFGAGIAGYLVGLPSLRLRGDYLAIVTLGFGEIIRIIFLNVDAVGGPRGLPGIPRESTFFWVYFWAFVTFLFLYRLMKSTYGRAILSIRENEIAAESMGIKVSHYKVVAFVISSFFAGIAGALFAHYQGFIDPATFNFNRSVDVVIMVVLGGMGSLSGALIGGIIVSLLPELLRMILFTMGGLPDTYRMVIFPLILIVLMLVRPVGLLGHKEIWDFFPSFKKKKGVKAHG